LKSISIANKERDREGEQKSIKGGTERRKKKEREANKGSEEKR
jgi:hypothetical protein